MSLSFHIVVWVSVLFLSALAPTLVGAYAAYLERRSRARADALLARFLSLGELEDAGAPSLEPQAAVENRAVTVPGPRVSVRNG